MPSTDVLLLLAHFEREAAQQNVPANRRKAEADLEQAMRDNPRLRARVLKARGQKPS